MRLPLLRLKSLRARLMVGLLTPVTLFIVINSALLYQQSLAAATTAYDRTLLASAKSIGEELEVKGYDDAAQLSSSVPYAALEAFEADNQSRMYYRVSGLDGSMVSGFDDLPLWKGKLPLRPPYAALVDFYDAEFRGLPVRMAVLMQPVASDRGRGLAIVQVAETLELRETLARQLLIDTLIRQCILLGVVALATISVVQRITQPVRQLGEAIEAREPDDFSPIDVPDTPRELRPLVDASTRVMGRLAGLLDHQKRFVRDSAHQLRTPLAVLKAQVQSAQRGDVPAAQALAEIGHTVDRATALANQMLSLAKVEQLRQQPESSVLDLGEQVQEVVLDLSPLVAQKGLDFELLRPAEAVQVLAHRWMVQELARNLIHNAIKHTPEGGLLQVRIASEADGMATLAVFNQGTGISEKLRERLFMPFAAGEIKSGSGLGLAICMEIVRALGGHLELINREAGPQGVGLDAVARLPRVG